jgi:thiamine biosynthesis lipoprotein
MRTPSQLLSRPTPGVPGGRASHGDLRVWGGVAHLSVADPAALPAAVRLARHHLQAVAGACDPRDPAAQVHELPAAGGAPVLVSPLLLRHVQAALDTAAATDGLVDPTAAPGRSPAGPATHGALPVCGQAVPRRAARGWRSVELLGRQVRVPGGTTLDLTASALPLALDDVALVVAQLTGSAVRITLHGRTAARDGAAGPAGGTSGAAAVDAGRVVDPRTGRPAAGGWARAEVVAGSARTASALAVAAVLHGPDAPDWLAERGVSARLAGPAGEAVVGDPVVLHFGLPVELRGGPEAPPRPVRPVPPGRPGPRDARAA